MNDKNDAYTDLVRALNKAAIITETDLDGNIIFVNDEFCRISGYSEKELLGKNHNLVNSGTHSKIFFGDMWRTIKNGNVWFGEICNRAKDGSLYWLQATILPIFHETNKEVYKYVAVRFDITEKKQSDLAMQRRAALYQAVIETTDGFCRIDKDGRFLEVSDGYCQLKGYSREELLTRKISDLNDSGNPPLLDLEDIADIMKGGNRTFEVERRRADNSIWIAEVTASYSPVDHGSVFMLLRDITERKNAEKRNENLRQQLNHIQKLDSIGRLTAGLAHDFNNILASILGYTEMSQLISEDIADESIKKDLTHNLQQVSIAGHRAAELIARMMLYCRQEKHNQKKAISKTQLTQPLIKDIVNMVQVGLTEKFKIELQLNDGTLDIVIEPGELHQVLTNLLVNARDAMGEKGGVITVHFSMVKLKSCQCVACSTKIEGNYIELSVSDTGSGIDKESHRNIFDPFFTTKGVGKGTGLGLSMVNGIVHHSGGHILIDSALNKGTTFRLLFPMILWGGGHGEPAPNIY